MCIQGQFPDALAESWTRRVAGRTQTGALMWDGGVVSINLKQGARNLAQFLSGEKRSDF